MRSVSAVAAGLMILLALAPALCAGLGWKMSGELRRMHLILLIPSAIAVYFLMWWPGHLSERWDKRLAAGLCPKCGYDLRASKDRCPECGKKIKRSV